MLVHNCLECVANFFFQAVSGATPCPTAVPCKVAVPDAGTVPAELALGALWIGILVRSCIPRSRSAWFRHFIGLSRNS